MLIAMLGTGPLAAWDAAADDTPLQIPLPPRPKPGQPDFDVFLALCRIVLMREHIDLAIARQLYEMFLNEPWGSKHIATAYSMLREIFIAQKGAGGSATVARAALPQGESWFISHLVTTWYVGVYYHPERPTKWITLQHALMFDAARNIVPARFRESVGFGGWAEPPPTSDRR